MCVYYVFIFKLRKMCSKSDATWFPYKMATNAFWERIPYLDCGICEQIIFWQWEIQIFWGVFLSSQLKIGFSLLLWGGMLFQDRGVVFHVGVCRNKNQVRCFLVVVFFFLFWHPFLNFKGNKKQGLILLDSLLLGLCCGVFYSSSSFSEFFKMRHFNWKSAS